MPKPRRLQYKSANGAPQAMFYKAATPGASTILASDDETGIVEALVSVTGVVDRQNDIIIPGAYARTLKTLKPNGHRYHDMARKVAKTLVSEEWMPGDSRLPDTLADGVTPWPKDAGALYIKGQYNLNTQDGRDAYENAKFFGAEGQWSIGYAPHGPNGARKRKDGVRELHDIDLYEWSDVSHGAAPFTRTLGAKDAAPELDTGGQPGGFSGDPLDAGKGGFRADQERAEDGTWTAGSGSNSASGGPNTANGLPEGWLGQVLKGDSRYVKPAGGGGGAGSASRTAEMDNRDAIDDAFDRERTAERKRRLAADRAIEAAEGEDKARLSGEEKARRRNWQDTYDDAVGEERARRRTWNAAHRTRTAGKVRVSDDDALFASEEPLGADGPDGVEVKMMDVLAGSYEEVRELIRLATERYFRDQLGEDRDDDGGHNWYVYVVGTYPDRAVVCLSGQGEREHFQFPVMLVSGDVVLGEPVEVTVTATVTPAAGGKDGYSDDDTKAAVATLIDDIAASMALADAAEVKDGSVAEGMKRLQFLVDDASDYDDDSVPGQLEAKDAIPIDEWNAQMAALGLPLVAQP